MDVGFEAVVSEVCGMNDGVMIGRRRLIGEWVVPPNRRAKPAIILCRIEICHGLKRRTGLHTIIRCPLPCHGLRCAAHDFCEEIRAKEEGAVRGNKASDAVWAGMWKMP